MRYPLAVLLMLSTPAWAEWVKYDEATDHTITYYYDPATVRVNGNFRRVWQVSDLKQRDKSGELSYRYLNEYDCKGVRFKMLYISGHSGHMLNREVLYSKNASGEWHYIAPDTASDTLFKTVCQ